MATSPRLLDLFTGTGSVARVAEELGYEVHTLDIDRRCKPAVRLALLPAFTLVAAAFRKRSASRRSVVALSGAKLRASRRSEETEEGEGRV